MTLYVDMFLKGTPRVMKPVKDFQIAVKKLEVESQPGIANVDKLYERLKHSTLADVAGNDELWKTVKAYGKKFETTRDNTFKQKTYQDGSLFKLVKVALSLLVESQCCF